ncbi:MAG: hypothetical protein NTY19_29640 [Planctomycetota bacterium]|nr:hypothetical protein [Planctomycetota bacterium]
MIIRKEQKLVFEEARLPDFEDYMVEHLKDFSPLHSQSLGEESIRGLIQMGVERAKKHGFTRRGPVKFYIETIILLGIAFDTDPQYPWLSSILRDTSISDQVERADRAHAWLVSFLDAAGGPDRQYAKQALRSARKIPLQATPVSSPGFTDEVISKMKENHPEKASYLGDAILRSLVPPAVKETRKHGIYTDTGLCLFLGLTFAIGHGFPNDPKYPWVANTLANPAITDADKRVDRLYSKTMTYLDHVLQHLEGK